MPSGRDWGSGARLCVAALVLASMAVVTSTANAGIVHVRSFPGPVTFVNSVACESSMRCYAVGSSRADQGILVPIVHGKPTQPLSVAGSNLLQSVACAGASCEAVGFDRAGHGVVVSIEAGKPSPARVLFPELGQLSGASCSNATICDVVGAEQGNLAQVTNGAPTVFTPLEGFDFMFGVGCAPGAIDVCEVVGGSGQETGRLAQTVLGVQQGRTIATGSMELDAVACPTEQVCYAAGGYAPPHRHQAVVAKLTNGVPGAPMTAPGLWTLSTISCSSTSYCVAAGNGAYGPHHPARGAVVVITSGRLGEPSLGPRTFTSVACPAEHDCYAVGNYTSRPDRAFVAVIR